MRHFKAPSGEVFGYDDDQPQFIEAALAAGMTELAEWPIPPSADEVAAAMAIKERAWRDEQLRLADIEINKLEDNGQDATAWRQYRQALRDVPTLKGFPTKFKRPVAPA